MSRWFCSWPFTNKIKETDMKNRGKLWKYFLVLLLAFSLSLPAFSEPETEFEIPDLEPETEYVMTGQDLITLYTTIKELNETKSEWKNLTLETQTNSKNALELAKEYEKENKKLTFQNNFLIGTTVCSVGICVAGVITFMCLNTK